MKFINHPESYIEPDGSGGYDYVFQHKDHLGNVRLSYSDADKDGVVDGSEIVEESNYYPFGLKHKGYNNTIVGAEHKYKYNGKELQDELGLNWYDYGARFYDPSTGKWFTPDALAEKYYDQSVYNYTLNNPILFIDPDGNQVEMCCKKLWNFVKGYVRGVVNEVNSRVDGLVNLATDPGGTIGAALEQTPNTFEGAAESTVMGMLENNPRGKMVLTVSM